jgi:uncharacterized membrane protein/Mg-chelatase subunit ChlD
MNLLAFLRFDTPGYLVLLALIPLLVVLSFRSLSGLGPARRVIALLARCAVVLLITLALAGAHAVRTSDELAVLFIVDRSSSIPPELQTQAFETIRKASEKLRPGKDRLGVLAFDGKTAVEQLPMGTLHIDRISAAIDDDRTDLAGALRLALALFPSDVTRRVVVLSDGNENVGDALQEADQYAAAGVPVDVVPIRYQHSSEIVFERLDAPPAARAEETINLDLVIRSGRRVSGQVLLYHNDKLVDLDPSGPGAGFAEQLEAGPNRLQIPVPLRVAGAHRFRAEFVPDDASADTIAGNNEGRAFTVVSGQGRILILTQELPAERQSAELLAAALTSEQLVCDVVNAGEQPLDQETLLGYSLVILSNVPSHLLSEEERTGLALYVRDLGGGLIMVGGDSSFGAGGWLDTPIEEIMPVTFDVKSKRQIPKGALVLLMHGCEIPEGNYWAERVGIAAVKALSSRDLIGVQSWNWKGADQGHWDVPLQPVGDKSRVVAGIRALQHGDAPDFEPMLKEAVDALSQRSDAAAKHIIVLSDFDPSGPTKATLDRMKRYGITCTTVAIGFGGHPIDVGKAQNIADTTGGKFYSTQDYRKLPQIFTKEAQIVRRSLIQEIEFTPSVASQLPSTIQGIGEGGLPNLKGYVLTTAKPLAQVSLVRETEEGQDPILAQWQVGLGKSVAFTSGLWNRWGVHWAAWPGYSKLWAQLARWASRPSASAAFDVSSSVQGGVGKVRIEALDADALALNNMNIEGTLVTPGYESQPLRLVQVGPGQYEATFDARRAGSYVLNVAYRGGRGGASVSGTLQTGLSVAYSPEFRELRTNEALLRELSQKTGGRLLEASAAATAFERVGLKPAEARRSIWELLARWMLLLFLLDVAIRRIAINPLEIARRLRRFVGEMGNRGAPAVESQAVLSTLKGTRERVRGGDGSAGASPSQGGSAGASPSQGGSAGASPSRGGSPSQGGEAGPTPNRAARYRGHVSPDQAAKDLNEALGGASESDKPVIAPPTRKPAPTSEADFTSRLLKAKKEARDQLRDEETKP